MIVFRRILYSIFCIFTHTYTTIAVHSSLITFTLLMCILHSGEKNVYEIIVRKSIQSNWDEQKQVTELLHVAHKLGKERQSIFAGKNKINSFRFKLFNSGDMQLLTAWGNCGSFSHILGMMLQTAGYEVRLCQMKVGDVPAGHILLEVKYNGSWAVLDPLFDVSFTKENGDLASFKDVKSNWDYYKKQIKGDYNFEYAYEDVRYTNWDKIPIVMSIVKKIIAIFITDDIEHFSLRSHVLNVYFVYICISILVQIFFLLTWVLFTLYRKSKNTSQASL